MNLPECLETYLKKLPFPRIPVRRYRHSDEVAAPSGKWGRVQWVLARARYRFRRFDLSRIPRASRAAALDLQLRQWSPYAESGYYISWHAGVALTFCWDAEQIGRTIAEQGLKPGRVPVLPETVLRPSSDGGARILAALTGFEGQIWAEGQLLQSRWWKDLPSEEAWLAFQRDAGLAPDLQRATPPAPESPDFLDAPWAGQSRFSDLIGTDWRDERLVYFGLALLLAAPTSWHASRIYGYRALYERMEAEYTALQQEAGMQATARGQAFESLARIRQLRDLDPYPQPMELMAWVAEHVLHSGDRVTEWDFQEGKLKFTLATSADLQSSTLVDLLQGSGLFDNVRSTPGKSPRSFTLEMDVRELKSDPAADRV
jgi:hypothetical protein